MLQGRLRVSILPKDTVQVGGAMNRTTDFTTCSLSWATATPKIVAKIPVNVFTYFYPVYVVSLRCSVFCSFRIGMTNGALFILLCIMHSVAVNAELGIFFILGLYSSSFAWLMFKIILIWIHPYLKQVISALLTPSFKVKVNFIVLWAIKQGEHSRMKLFF